MQKNKVVIFNNLGRAKVYITENPESLGEIPEGYRSFVNPDLVYVKDLPPEFWRVTEDGSILPIVDEVQIRERLKDLLVKEHISTNDKTIRESLSHISEIPSQLYSIQIDIARTREELILSRIPVCEIQKELAQFKKDAILALSVLLILTTAIFCGVYFLA